MSPRHVVWFSAFFVLMAGCDRDQPATAPETPASPSRDTKIPPEVSYPIIRDDEADDPESLTRTVWVRLNMRVSPEVLREIALDVKSQEKHQHEVTLIYYYLPEVVPDVQNEAWATTHFNPTLEVKILGLTQEDVELLSHTPIDHPGTRIGAWLVDMTSLGHLTVLYEVDGVVKDLYVSRGGRIESEMIELPASRGRRFRKVRGTEIYEVDPYGTLRMYDEDGPFVAAMPLE